MKPDHLFACAIISIAALLNLSACGGGSDSASPVNAAGAADNAVTAPSSLSADQAALESMLLAPGVIYRYGYSLPSIGDAIDNRYFFVDQSESLIASPLTHGPQRANVGLATSVANKQSFTVFSNWYLVNGKLVSASFPFATSYRYAGSAIVVDTLAIDGVSKFSSITMSEVSSVALSGRVAASPTEFKAMVPTLFSNSALLKIDVDWQPGAAYLKYTVTRNSDQYYVSDSSPNGTSTVAPAPLLLNTSLASQLAGAGITVNQKTYTQVNGTLSNINGIPTFIANAPIDGAMSPGLLLAFYEIGGNVYVGQISKAGVANTAMVYNTAARNSLHNAMTF